MKSIFYVWKIMDTRYHTVRNWGVSTESTDMFVDEVIPELNSGIDRDMWHMQEYIEQLYPDGRYKFTYKSVRVDLKDFSMELIE